MTCYSRSEASVHEKTHIHDRPEPHDTWISTYSEHGVLHPRTSFIVVPHGECSDLEANEVDLTALSHISCCHGDIRYHTTQIFAAGALRTAQITPVHPRRIGEWHGAGCHWAMPSRCTSEDVEIVNVIISKRQAYHATRRRPLYNFVQCGDIGRRSAEP